MPRPFCLCVCVCFVGCQWAVKEARPDTLAVVDLLVAAGVPLSAVNAAGTSPLHWSVHSDSDALITGLVHRVCPELAESEQVPPTPSTAAVTALPVCGALLARNERNETVLHWAVDWQKAVAVSTLLRLADGSRASATSTQSAARELVHISDANGDTPLHRLPLDCPSSAPCRLIAQQIVARGANVTAENAAHRTPLAHFPTPAVDEESADGRRGGAVQSDELDAAAAAFRRNLSTQFSTVP